MADKWEDKDEDGPAPDSWEDEEPKKQPIKDSWEDEEEEIKDSWDQEEDTTENPKEAPKNNKAASTKKKEATKEMTEEEKREAQLKADLNHTTELFGVAGSLDQIVLKTKEDYTDYINRFFAKMNIHNDAPLYVDFLDDLFKAMCKDLSVESTRKLSNSLRTVYDNKVAEEKLKSKDSKTKGKGKGKIKIEFDRVKGDFDSFLKDSHKAGYDEDDGGEDFI